MSSLYMSQRRVWAVEMYPKDGKKRDEICNRKEKRTVTFAKPAQSALKKLRDDRTEKRIFTLQKCESS